MMKKNTDNPEIKTRPGFSNNRKEYEQGFFITLLIFFLGAALEWMTAGQGASLPRWPVNLQIGLGFILLLLFLHFYYRDTVIIKWLSRVPSAVTSIVLFTVLVLILGLSRQNDPDASYLLKITGLNHIRNSYVFLLSGLYLLTCLGLVALRRLTPFSFKNIGFALNHIGLWIIVFAGSLGAGDLERLNIYVEEGQSVWYAYNSEKQPREIPFTVKLIDFDIEVYAPKLALIEQPEMRVPKDVKNNFNLVEKGLNVNLAGWDIRVTEFLPSAKPDHGKYVETSEPFSVPAAFIEASSLSGQGKISGWLSSGNFNTDPAFVFLDRKYALALTEPEAREFSSLLEIVEKSGQSDTVRLIVNDPVKVGAWQLYQLSYDETRGKWSTLSVIEAIRDPWLSVIYTGIFMVLAGAVYLFWIGRKPKID